MFTFKATKANQNSPNTKPSTLAALPTYKPQIGYECATSYIVARTHFTTKSANAWPLIVMWGSNFKL